MLGDVTLIQEMIKSFVTILILLIEVVLFQVPLVLTQPALFGVWRQDRFWEE